MKTCPQCGTSYDDAAATCDRDGATLIAVKSDPNDPRIGRLLAGRYLLIEKLGQGGMGAVYRALHTQMERPCAIKLLAPLTVDAEAAKARFKREARMASRIDNPHAVTIYDFGEAEDDQLYLAMELIEGRVLSRVMAQEGPLSIDRIVRITAQIAEALHAAHEIGIVHRDLKPDNIMLTRKGDVTDFVKVLDFGIAKTVSDDGAENLTQTGFVLGTPVYMSPEQLSGEALDARSDVYSLAIITFEMLTGRLPFAGDNLQAITIRRVTEEAIPLRAFAPSMSAEVEAAVMAGLRRSRDERIDSARGFAAALYEAVYGGTMSFNARPTSGIPGDRRATTPMDDREAMPRQGAIQTSDTLPMTRLAQDAPTVKLPEASSAPMSSAPMSGTPASGAPQPAPPSQYVTNPSRSLHPELRQAPQAAAAPAVRVAPTEAARRVGSRMWILVVVLFVLGAIGGIAGYFLLRPDPTAPAPPVTLGDVPVTPGGGTAGSGTAGNTTGEEATIYFEQGKRHQEQAEMLKSAGSTPEAMEENQKAIDAYRKALAARSVFPEARENLAVALYSIGQLDAALSEYRAAIDQYIALYQKPTAQVYANYGLALYDMRRYREAADAFAEALALEPDDYDLHAFRGFALQNAGDMTAARAAYQQYLRFAPEGHLSQPVRDIMAGREKPPEMSGN